jgi:ABC-2 type transport system permease protein
MFVTPLAWVVLAVVQCILAYQFLSKLDDFIQVLPRLAAVEGAPGLTELVIMPLFSTGTVLLLLIVPMITMRAFSDEKRGGTWALLVSAPVSVSEIVIGKFCGSLVFFLILIGLLVSMPLSLLLASAIDLGHLGAATLALILLAASFTAIGMFTSAMCIHPAAAAVASFGIALMLWIVDWRGSETPNDAMAYLSMLKHFSALVGGQISSVDVVYFILVIAVALALTVLRLDADNWWSAR